MQRTMPAALLVAAVILFAGANFDSPIIARVRITSGNTPIGPSAEDNVKGRGRKHDIVAMDDFIYGEPRAASQTTSGR